MGMVQGLKAASYTLAEAKQAGYVDLKAAGFTLNEMKQAGYTCAEAKQAGFNPRECMQAGFTHQEGEAAGYPPMRDMYGRPLGYNESWKNGKPPPRIETLAARALRLRPPPPGEAGRFRRRATARAARALCVRPAGVASPRCRLTPARARGVLAWRRRGS